MHVSLPRPRDSEYPIDNIEWVLADAWVLAAARLSGSMEQRAGLFDLVVACDAVNHLIVSRQELEHAMSMLVGADLMVADEAGIAVTPAGRELVAQAGRSMLDTAPGDGHGRKSPEVRIQALFRLLGDLPVTPVPFELDPRTYEAACLEYRHTRWTEFRKSERRF